MMLIVQVLHLFSGFLILEAILSWMVGPHDFPRNHTRKLTEPLYAPLRRVMNPQKTGGLDLSPLVWIFGIQIVAGALAGVA
jgi:YggT family protein